MMTISAYCIIIALLCCLYANAVGAHSNISSSSNNNQRLDISSLKLTRSLPSKATRPVIQQQQQQPNRRLFARSDLRQQQQTPSGPPKLVQWAKEAVQYYEGSTLVLSCSLASSISPASSPVKFAWFKQGKPLAASPAGSASGGGSANLASRLSVETLVDYSFFRLSQLRSSDSGAYTCVASNSLGQEDRTTAQVIVNVKLRWLDRQQQQQQHNEDDDAVKQVSFIGGQHELATVRAGQSVILECGAAAQPLPRIRWFRLAPPPAGLSAKQPPASAAAAAAADNSIMPFSSHHHQAQPAALSKAQIQFRLDEAQIRSNLMQQQADDFLFHRLELANSMDDLVGRSRGSTSSNETVDRLNRHWRIETHSSGLGQHELSSRLILDRADANSNGLYECEASSAGENAIGSHPMQQQQQQTPDRLRKLFGVLVNDGSHQVAHTQIEPAILRNLLQQQHQSQIIVGQIRRAICRRRRRQNTTSQQTNRRV